MATPTPVLVTGPGGGAHILRGRAAARPAWRTAMAPNTWIEVPTANMLSDLNPKNDPALNPVYPGSPEWYGTTGFPAIVSAYNGACFDQAVDDWWWVLQGGHDDYAGNDKFKASMRAASPLFVTVRPTFGTTGNPGVTNDGQEATGLYGGKPNEPRSIHSYNKPVFVPGVGPTIAVQGNTSRTGQSGTGRMVFIDPVTGVGTLGADNPDAGTSSGGGGRYDPTRNATWWRHAGTGYFSRYSHSTSGPWARVGNSKAVSGYSALEYLPNDDCLLWLNDDRPDGVRVFDCATGILYEPATTGASVGAVASGRCQPWWVPELNGCAYWDNSSNTTVVNVLNKPADPRTGVWAITQLPVAPANTVTPTVKTAAGTFGRFAYSPNLDGFFLLNAVNQKPFFYARS